MQTQVCCPCIRTGRCTRCCCRKKGCTNCRNPDCTSTRPRQPDHRRSILPGTREEAIIQGVEILKEHVFRCDRGAYMNYKLSADYDWWVMFLTAVITLVMGFSTGVIGKGIVSYMDLGKTSNSWLDYLSFILSALIGGTMAAVNICPKYLLPVLENRCTSHNEAGAGWQELDIQIRGFLATNIEHDLTPQKLEEFIQIMSEKRRAVCEIARPTEKMHMYCVDNSDKFKKRRDDLKQAVFNYWN